MALDDPDLPMHGVLPTESELSRFVTVELRHERPDVVCSLMLPDGWCQQPPPPGKPDLSVETEFVPLGVFTPGPSYVPPIVVSIGVRPAPRRGAVAECLERHAHAQGLVVQRLEVHEFLFGPAADAFAMQAGDVGQLALRIVMFEDGGRLFVLSAMAPRALWSTVVATLSLALLSFELAEPQGRTLPILSKPEEG